MDAGRMDEAGLAKLTTAYGAVSVVEFNDREMVFRRPSRADIRDYRRKQDDSVLKVDALDQLANVTIVAFDGVSDPTRAREAFLAFLEKYPAVTSSRKLVTALNALSGTVEETEALELGKSAGVRLLGLGTTPTASTPGSEVSATEPSRQRRAV